MRRVAKRAGVADTGLSYSGTSHREGEREGNGTEHRALDSACDTKHVEGAEQLPTEASGWRTNSNGGKQNLPAGYRRNFWCLAMDFCFFGTAMALVGPSTVIPGFLSELGASTALIGLLASLQRAGWMLPQLVAARYLADKPYKKPYILIPGSISRFLILVLAGMTWAIGVRSPQLTIGVTIFAFSIFWVADGLGSLAWFDFLSKSVPPHRRGRLTSVGQIMGGIGSFAAGFLVEWILSNSGPSFPGNYAWLFFLGFGLLLLSLAALALGVESPGITEARVPSWREYLPQLWRVVHRDRPFRRYLITRQVFGLSGLAIPFYMTYALEGLGLPAQVAGRYTSIGVIGGIAAAAFFGWTNERYGTRRAAQISIVVTAFVPGLALLIPQIVADPVWLAWTYGLVFLAMQASMSCFLPAWTAFVLEWAPEQERPLYVGLTNTLNGITALFSTLGGLILAWTGGNYNVLFIVTALGTLAALPLALTIPEPRDVERVSVLLPG
jgi:MFS family permease